ncbi:hypothetical protein GCM10007939_09500 [Amylibacter marinus]|uniref:Uncharacterized protein n=1 Tax=Amylibacter marinus TaxID=1475483 RepID=A0ABQ5VU14_9RHOB|nr:hypothetical protein GCM10007939_09500 [Amylibacter marinus]
MLNEQCQQARTYIDPIDDMAGEFIEALAVGLDGELGLLHGVG